MNRFVIHKHTRDGNAHWDLMLEQTDCLQTWRIDTSPQDWITGPVKAEKIFDHDKKFLTYQGPVNNGQGSVEIIDKGTCTIKSSNKNYFEITFEGKFLKETFKLNLIPG